MGSDLSTLRAALLPVQGAAADLPWASERPWRVDSHIWLEGALIVVDCHDLNVRLARMAVDATGNVAEELDAGAVCFIVGRGRHSMGKAQLGQAVGAAVGHVARAKDWDHGPMAAGRYALIMDRNAAPRSATGQLGWAFWLGSLAFAIAAGFAWPPLGAVVAALLLGVLFLDRKEQK